MQLSLSMNKIVWFPHFFKNLFQKNGRQYRDAYYHLRYTAESIAQIVKNKNIDRLSFLMDGNLNLGANGRFDIDDLEIEKMEQALKQPMPTIELRQTPDILGPSIQNRLSTNMLFRNKKDSNPFVFMPSVPPRFLHR